MVTQLADVLTYRLLRKTPGLLNTRASVDSNCAETLDFHRNYMETTTVRVRVGTTVRIRVSTTVRVRVS